MCSTTFSSTMTEFSNEQVNFVSTLDFDAIIDNRKPDLTLCSITPLAEFMHQTLFVHAFQHARAKGGVDFHGCVYNSAGDLVNFHVVSKPIYRLNEEHRVR